MASHLELEESRQNGWVVVSLAGELDYATAPRLRFEFDGLDLTGPLRVVVDLDGLDFLDSSGIGALVRGANLVRGHGGELRLVCRHSHLRRAFEVTGLARVVDIRDNVTDALEPPARLTPNH